MRGELWNILNAELQHPTTDATKLAQLVSLCERLLVKLEKEDVTQE